MPLNAEGWLGLAITGLLVMGRSEAWPTTRTDRLPRWRIAAAAVVTLAVFGRALQCSFLADDFVLVSRANGPLHFGRLLTMPGGDGFYRPLGYVSLWGTAAVAGVDAVWWHAAVLGLHLLNSALVFALCLRLTRAPGPALFGGLLFAIHGAHPEAVVWIAGRFDLLAAFFVLAGLLLFLHWRSTAGALAAMVCGILCKETAYVFPLLLAALPDSGEDPRRPGIRALAPFFAAAAALFVWRWWLCGGIGGYRDPLTGRAQALIFGPPTVKALALRLWAALYFPINWSTPPGGWMAVLGLAYVAALVWLGAFRPSRAASGFALALTVVPALPALQLLAIGADLGNSRLLYLPSAGFCLLLALAAEGLRGPVRWLAPAAILVFHSAVLEHNLAQWQDVSRKAQAAGAVAVECLGGDRGKAPRRLTDWGLPGALHGVPFFANVYTDHLAILPQAGPAARDGERGGTLVWEAGQERLRCEAPGNSRTFRLPPN